MIFSDKLLSKKIERAEAHSNIDFIDSRFEMFPESGAKWIDIGGAYVGFDTARSPATQTFGLGMFDKVTDVEMDQIERFFKRLGAPVVHEISPLADPDVFQILNDRGYQPIEFTNVMFQSLESAGCEASVPQSQVSTRVILPSEIEKFAQFSTEGWVGEMPEYADQMVEFCTIGANRNGAVSFFAEIDFKPIGTATVYIHEDVAHLEGASTIPAQRRKGAQAALLKSRLQHARENGCTVAVMGATPGSQSQRNAEKNGFRIAYTRTKWQLKKQQN